MGSVLGSTVKNKEAVEMALSKAKDIVNSTPVVVFSKTYCGYCARVKQLFSQLGANYKTIEMDVESDGKETQAALAEWTGQTTVPNVFIGGKHVGGCDKVMHKHKAGLLVPLLTEAGAFPSKSENASSSSSNL
ncbi:glutaredoxin-like [Impatiens glandulifera]|uniref:glutaredoxin-like n=1 Tax=Impatiens glandulifera TaxID=253017 RepID=UPI001FB0B6D8|nr:glutaredoxin-like [Impatiens glandulifera]